MTRALFCFAALLLLTTIAIDRWPREKPTKTCIEYVAVNSDPAANGLVGYTGKVVRPIDEPCRTPQFVPSEHERRVGKCSMVTMQQNRLSESDSGYYSWRASARPPHRPTTPCPNCDVLPINMVSGQNNWIEQPGYKARRERELLKINALVIGPIVVWMLLALVAAFKLSR